MKKSGLFFSGMVLVSILLASCAPQTNPAPTVISKPQITATSGPVTRNVLIGFSTSLSGNLKDESQKQTNGILLWMNQVNQRGGLVLKDGTILTFEPKFYDDQSDSAKVEAIYDRLVLEDNVDFFFSPYSSELMDFVAHVPDKYQKIMIAPGVESETTFKRGYQNIYQVYAPTNKYLFSVLDLLAQKDPAAKKIAIVHETETFSISVAYSLKKYAETRGFEVVALESYPSATTDFVEIIQKIKALAPDALLGGGHALDGQALVKQAFENALDVKMMVILAAPNEPGFASLGQAATGIISLGQWTPQVRFLKTFGPGVDNFNLAYQTSYLEEPTYLAAGGYTAGLILEKALLEANSLDQKKIQEALEEMDMITFFGPIRFDSSSSLHGMQIGKKIIYTQWQKNADGLLVNHIIWPEDARTSNLLYPLP
jgi:branched-chain amino acid transport system substrate-binding protein